MDAASIQEETLEWMKEAGVTDDDLDVSYINDSLIGDLEDAGPDPDLETDDEGEDQERGVTVIGRVIYGHTVLRQGNTVYYKKVGGSNGNGPCLQSAFYTTRYNSRQQVIGRCPLGSTLKYSL